MMMKRLSVSNVEGICKQALFALEEETRRRRDDRNSSIERRTRRRTLSKYSGSVTTVMDNWKSRAIDTTDDLTRGLGDSRGYRGYRPIRSHVRHRDGI